MKKIQDPGEIEWIEASFMHKHEGFYYLFVNWFGCCDGVDSTYEIHMGWSETRSGRKVEDHFYWQRMVGT